MYSPSNQILVNKKHLDHSCLLSIDGAHSIKYRIRVKSILVMTEEWIVYNEFQSIYLRLERLK